MSVIGSNILAGASGQGGVYNLTKSLRFRSSASAYLNRTPASAGNRQTWTWSGWIKRGSLATTGQTFFDAYAGLDDRTQIQFDNNQLRFLNQVSASVISDVRTTQVFRDPSAWYHIVITLDTTQATSSNRIKLYVNGSQITALATATYQNQNTDTYINATNVHDFGRTGAYTNEYFDGYLAEVNFIDGQALTPSSFGETSTTTGVWIPKKYTGTYGTNGFYLPFTDTTSTSTLGTDFSGNSNTWTVNNISLTSGSTYDSMNDVPTLTSVTQANYATLNPLLKPTNTLVFSNGNLNLTVGTPPSSTNNGAASGTMAVSSGKWYWEITAGDNFNGGSANYTSIGIGNLNTINSTGEPHVSGSYMYYANGNNANGFYWDGSSFTSYGAAYKQGNIIGVALDLDTNQITWYVNNSSQGSKTITAGSYVPRIGGAIDVGNIVANFGQRPFSYTPPTGFVALNTFNLP